MKQKQHVVCLNTAAQTTVYKGSHSQSIHRQSWWPKGANPVCTGLFGSRI